MKKITASSAKQAVQCGASHVLPSAFETGDFAEKGNEGHDFFDLCALNRRKEALKKYKDSEHFKEWVEVDMDLFLKGVTHVATEVAFAINVFTGEAQYIGHHIGRKYPELGPGWICGSEDFVGMVDGIPVVNDWKTGDWVGPVEKNLQVGFHAYAVHYLTGAPRVEGRISYTRKPELLERHIFDADAFHFDAVLASLRKAHDNVLEAQKLLNSGVMPPVYPGEECKYCAARASCPKWTGLIKAFQNDFTGLDVDTWKQSLTVDKIAEIWPKYKQLKALFEEVNTAIKGFVEQNGAIPLENGKFLRMVDGSREYTDGKKLARLAKYYGASDQELADCVAVSTYKQMKELKK